MNREDDCVEHMHTHVGQCTRRGYANGFADGAAQGLAALLSTCDRTHGGDHNDATVYGHHASVRICIRLHDSDQWVYDPRWETHR